MNTAVIYVVPSEHQLAKRSAFILSAEAETERAELGFAKEP